MKNIQHFILAALACAVLTIAMAGTAKAQGYEAGTACPKVEPPVITVSQFKGNLRMTREKNAFQLAREKSVKYGIKMPMEQGNIGAADFRTETIAEIETFPSVGCLAVRKLTSKVMLDHRFELASDYAEGSCMYNELYNLEVELMTQDEEVVNREIEALRTRLKETLARQYTRGPIVGIDIDQARSEWKAEIEKMIKEEVAKIKTTIDSLRQQSDLPEFFEEIKAECSGMAR